MIYPEISWKIRRVGGVTPSAPPLSTAGFWTDLKKRREPFFLHLVYFLHASNRKPRKKDLKVSVRDQIALTSPTYIYTDDFLQNVNKVVFYILIYMLTMFKILTF